jgi:D-serine deaminase-like pyridoxal phosphate-dependent protein
MNLSRRTVVLGGVAGTAALIYGIKPSDRGAPHNAYFRTLSNALMAQSLAQPTLIIDQQRMTHNIQQVQKALTERKSPLPIRLVVKSLPSLPLLDTLVQTLKTQRFMVFNLPMLSIVQQHYPQGDFLLGKPFAALAVRQWLTDVNNRHALPRIQWLIDSTARLKEYADIAQSLKLPMKVSFEIDVGLHRGGFTNSAELKEAVALVKQYPLLMVSGLMGYEAHVGKMPTLFNMQQNAWHDVQQIYTDSIRVLKDAGYNSEQLVFNSGGSQTYNFHAQGTVANEISVGTAFVQPSDFDMPSLSQHQAASFIATPVLKVVDPALMPGIEWSDGLRRWWDANNQHGYFIHGGHWLAKPESPQGLASSDLYGHSSNQELWLGSPRQQLKMNDYVFFRPQQSEAVFLQFGDIALFDAVAGKIVARWPVFPASA